MLGIGDGGAITHPVAVLWAAVAAGSVAGETVGDGIGPGSAEGAAGRVSDLHRHQNGITPFACPP